MIRKIEKDYHGYTIVEAVHDAEGTFLQMQFGTAYEVTFITGHGKIRDEIKDICERFEVDWSYQPGNEGAIVAFVPEE